ncbi:MAG: heavy metal-associated domain-containing protein [Rhizobiaceae bacterium]
MEVALKIEGMHCGGCAASVEKALKAAPGIRSVTVDLAGGSARVEADADADTALIVAAVEDAGYDARIDPAS